MIWFFIHKKGKLAKFNPIFLIILRFFLTSNVAVKISLKVEFVWTRFYET